MLKIYYKSLIALFGLLTLVGCAATPTHISLTPALDLSKQSYHFTNQQAWQVMSKDSRVAHYLIEIVNDGNIAKLVDEQTSARLVVESNLTKGWINNKLNVNPSSDSKIEIDLIKALATVTQSSVSNDVSSQMMIQVTLKHRGDTFVKMFRSNRQWNAAFAASVAGIREELSTQLSVLLTQILEDEQLNKKLQQW